jgi:hypothetical protein
VTFLANDSDMPVGLKSQNKGFLGDDCNLAPNSSCSYSVIAFPSRFELNNYVVRNIISSFKSFLSLEPAYKKISF